MQNNYKEEYNWEEENDDDARNVKGKKEQILNNVLEQYVTTNMM